MRSTLIDSVYILAFAVLTGLAAAVKLPFMPYHPITAQIIVVLLSGALLGSFRGPMSQLVFVALGLAGLPLFRDLAPGYPAPAFGASPEFIRVGLKVGWLQGFVAASYVTGVTLEYARSTDFRACAIAVFGGVATIYICGVAFPVLVLRAPLTSGFLSWLWPFLGMDLLKALLALLFLANINRFRRLELLA